MMEGKVMTPRVREILHWYGADHPGTLSKLAQVLNHGHLAGTGKVAIYAVAEAFTNGENPRLASHADLHDPIFHFARAVETGASAVVAPLGVLQAACRDFCGEIPFFLKVDAARTKAGGEVRCSSLSDLPSLIKAASWMGAVGLVLRVELTNCHVDSLAPWLIELRQAGLLSVISFTRSAITERLETVAEMARWVKWASEQGAHFVHIPFPGEMLVASRSHREAESEVPGRRRADILRPITEAALNGQRLVVWDLDVDPVQGEEEYRQRLLVSAAGGGFGFSLGRALGGCPPAVARQTMKDYMEILVGRELK